MLSKPNDREIGSSHRIVRPEEANQRIVRPEAANQWTKA